MPGAHKIGAAISGPRIAGGNFMDITLFLTCWGAEKLRIADLRRFAFFRSHVANQQVLNVGA